jgi:hypothetical protein
MPSQQVHLDDVEVGQEIPSLVKRCSTRQLVMWAAASGDFYEIHYDLDFARRNRLDGLLVHGALKHAFLGQLLHDWVAPGGRVTAFGCSYRGTDGPEEPLTCRGRVTGKKCTSPASRVEARTPARTKRRRWWSVWPVLRPRSRWMARKCAPSWPTT